MMMDRKQRRAEARSKAISLRERIRDDERKPFWSRGLSWLLVVKLLLEILFLFLDSEDD